MKSELPIRTLLIKNRLSLMALLHESVFYRITPFPKIWVYAIRIGSLIVCVVFIFLPHSYRSKSCNPKSPKIFFERGVLN